MVPRPMTKAGRVSETRQSERQGAKSEQCTALELMMLALRDIKAPPPLLLPKGGTRPRDR